jgi:hypothetical protein
VRLCSSDENGKNVRREGEETLTSFLRRPLSVYMNSWGYGRSTVDDRFQMLQ